MKTVFNSFLRAATVAFAFFVLAPEMATFGADANGQPSKISGRVRFHQKIKARPAGVSADEHKKNLRERGVNAEKLDSEEVAFYVTRPLTTEEVQAYGQRGIKISTDNWVPPVPGRHAHGYYLAEVPYSRLDELEADGRVARIDSTEQQSKPKDDVARALTQVSAVHAGSGPLNPYTGAGVRIAIADSALDVGHPDFTNNPPFETYDMTTGTGTNNWSKNVATNKTSHGTQITGVLVGSGTNSSGQYRGVAPSAQWAFYKIGGVNGGANETDEIEALNRAVTTGCKVFNMSFGSFGGFLDGSESMEQAIDAAVASNVAVFIAAGNEASAGQHKSISVPPGTTTSGFGLNVDNASATSWGVLIDVVWRENGTAENQIVLSCTNLAAGESLASLFTDTSSRQTRLRQYHLTGSNIVSRSLGLRLQNTSGSGAAPLVHCYAIALTASVSAEFAIPDPNYTVNSPAVADGAIAVAAQVHRTNWFTCSSLGYHITAETLGTIATFSSRGPRIDGLQKPDMAAPGCLMIAASTRLEATDPVYQIPNVGVAGCSYAVAQGTSVASPHAAGIAALMLQAQPGLTPADLRTLLTTTGSAAASRNILGGWGLMNASNAVYFSQSNFPGVWVNYAHAGVEEGNFSRPFNTVIEAVTNAPSAPPAIIPRVRINAGNRTESIRITNGLRIESFGGTARFGTP